MTRREKRNFVDRVEGRLVVPFFHAVLSNLKAIASVFCNSLVFKNDYRLFRVFGFGGSMASQCGVKRKQPVVVCIKGVAYEIRVACGFHCVGQTARCLKERMTKPI